MAAVSAITGPLPIDAIIALNRSRSSPPAATATGSKGT
jgi:hypothetical protein